MKLLYFESKTMQQRKRDVVTMVMRKKRTNLEVKFTGPGVEVWGLDTAKVLA